MRRKILPKYPHFIITLTLLSFVTLTWGESSSSSLSAKTTVIDSQVRELQNSVRQQNLLIERLSSELDSIKADIRILKQENLTESEIRQRADDSTWWALSTLRLIGAISIVVLGASILGTIYGIRAGRNVQEDVASIREIRQITEKERKEYEKTIDKIKQFTLEFAGYAEEYITVKSRHLFQEFEARVTIGEMLGYTPSAEDYEKMATFLQRIEQWDRALLRADQALAINPNLAWSHYTKAVSLGMVAKKETKAEVVQELLREGHVHVLRAIRLLETKNHEDEWMVHFALGWILMNLGEFREAIVSYHKAGSVEAIFPGIRYNIAICLSGLGRFQEAVEMVQLALEIPENKKKLADDGEQEFSRALQDPVFGPRLRELIEEARAS